MKEIVTLSSREIQRIQVLERVCRGALTLVEGTPLLRVCYRQAKRLLALYREEGPRGLAHRWRGQPGSVFRKIGAAERYLKVCFAYEATVANDNTVRLGGLIIDIPPGPNRRSYARRRVLARQHLGGAWTLWLDETCIARHPYGVFFLSNPPLSASSAPIIGSAGMRSSSWRSRVARTVTNG